MKLSQSLYPERLEQALIDAMPEMVSVLGGDVSTTEIHHKKAENNEDAERRRRDHYFTLPGPQDINVQIKVEEVGSKTDLHFQVQDLLGRWLTINYSIDNALSYNMKLEIGHHPAMPQDIGSKLLSIVDTKLSA